MQIQNLNEDQVKEIYYRHICEDFPADERKPYWKIQQYLRKGKYLCLGMFGQEGELLVYAFFMKTANVQDPLLLDYYAVVSNKRSHGYGSIFLRLLGDHITQNIVGEVEDPSATRVAEERTNRQRRIGFYLKNGFVDTGVRCKFFGVQYCMMCKMHDVQKNLDIRAIRKFYDMVYKNAFPANRLRFWKKREHCSMVKISEK